MCISLRTLTCVYIILALFVCMQVTDYIHKCKNHSNGDVGILRCIKACPMLIPRNYVATPTFTVYCTYAETCDGTLLRAACKHQMTLVFIRGCDVVKGL